MKNLEEKIKKYWEDPKTVSLKDITLHKLEIETVKKHLKPNDFLLDVGCGDGEATVEYAKTVKNVIGIERSHYLYEKANQHAIENGSNAVIMEGDVLEGLDIYNADVIITMRVLINLISWEQQKKAIANIYKALKPKGRYIMVEDIDDGLVSLNDLRVSMGLNPIKRHWHNQFFDHIKLIEYMFKIGFCLEKYYDFNLYYLITRVYTPLFCDTLEYTGTMDEAAKKLQDEHGKDILVKGCRTISPIQVFVFVKK